jgi:hypothetical protein
MERKYFKGVVHYLSRMNCWRHPMPKATQFLGGALDGELAEE